MLPGSGSIHTLVPVYPVWPYDFGPIFVPADEPVPDFVSHPSPLVLDSDCLRVNRFRTSRSIRVGLSEEKASTKWTRLSSVENSPA